MTRTIVNINELETHSESSGTRFQVAQGRIGPMLGLTRLGATLHIVQPCKIAFPFHRHHIDEELFLILSGTGVYRTDNGNFDVKPGDCLGAPAGGIAHQIINTGNVELRYLGVSTIGPSDLVEYIDSKKISVGVGSRGTHYFNTTFKARGRIEPAGHWDGEDIGEEK